MHNVKSVSFMKKIPIFNKESLHLFFAVTIICLKFNLLNIFFCQRLSHMFPSIDVVSVFNKAGAPESSFKCIDSMCDLLNSTYKRHSKENKLNEAGLLILPEFKLSSFTISINLRERLLNISDQRPLHQNARIMTIVSRKLKIQEYIEFNDLMKGSSKSTITSFVDQFTMPLLRLSQVTSSRVMLERLIFLFTLSKISNLIILFTSFSFLLLLLPYSMNIGKSRRVYAPLAILQLFATLNALIFSIVNSIISLLVDIQFQGVRQHAKVCNYITESIFYGIIGWLIAFDFSKRELERKEKKLITKLDRSNPTEIQSQTPVTSSFYSDSTLESAPHIISTEKVTDNMQTSNINHSAEVETLDLTERSRRKINVRSSDEYSDKLFLKMISNLQ